MTIELTRTEQKRLEDCEFRLSNHVEEAGKILIEIRDNRLYRGTHKTFEEYAEYRWGYSRPQIYRTIQFHQMKLSPIGDKIQNEGQAREIAKVPEKKRAEVLEAVEASGEPVTAKAIAKAAEVVAPKAKPPKIPEPPEPPQVRKDKTGYPIPDHRLPIFDRAKEVKELLDQVSAVRNRLRRAQDDQDALFRPIDFSSTLTQLDAVFGEIKVAMPHAVCPFCQGQTSDQCRACHRRGVISQFHWNTTVPQELKDIRQAANS